MREGSRIAKRLADILVLDEGEIRLDPFEIPAASQQLQQVFDRETVAADTDLTTEFVRLDGQPIEPVHGLGQINV